MSHNTESWSTADLPAPDESLGHPPPADDPQAAATTAQNAPHGAGAAPTPLLGSMYGILGNQAL